MIIVILGLLRAKSHRMIRGESLRWLAFEERMHLRLRAYSKEVNSSGQGSDEGYSLHHEAAVELLLKPCTALVLNVEVSTSCASPFLGKEEHFSFVRGHFREGFPDAQELRRLDLLSSNLATF
ncbi:hypothetical protein MUO14_09970 [Halobacillus shinanisalinarum]|uniref:Uncharacterized protein n=1 Tax=Halobacillus shinanisalinarum TaxID=2932258 RepID=A0ABY4H426_9BACI|nr:hypothetical protein [Halobacillus shinanisalinarum]UOQ95218.1 hypothetical protein MUO14_09970 [Halobacillus shinanisalinarum]